MKRYIIILGTLLCLTSIFAEGAKYLIITHQYFSNVIQPLKNWKHKKGLKTKVVTFSSVPTSNAVRDTIRKYQPEYVLLAGLWQFIPLSKHFPDWEHLGQTWTDQQYADTTIDSEYKDDVYLGRFPCSTATQCSIMVNKTLSYERGNLKHSNWFIKATGIARDSAPDSTLWQGLYKDAIRSIDSLLMSNGFTQVDTLFAGHGADSTTVEDSVTNGRGFVVYRGGVHNKTDNWRSPLGVRPENINNDSMPTIVISTSCRTMFPFYPAPDSERRSAVGKRWLKQGTITIPRGAAGLWGTSTHYCAGYYTPQVYWRNAAAIRFFRAITEENENIFGKAIRKAKDSAEVCCLQSTGNARACSVAYMEWNLLGDPELNLWTKMPQQIVVTHEHHITTGSQSFTVTAGYVHKGQQYTPIESALVCVMMPNDTSVYQYDYTDINGLVSLPINPTMSGQLYVTVTAHNFIPYEDSCVVASIGENATSPNQGKHLVRKLNTSEIHRTFEADGRIFYQMSSNWGQTWTTPTYLGDGNYPCIAIGPQGGTPWVLWGSSGQYGPLYAAVKRPNETWKIWEVFPIGEELHTTPSMVLATLTSEQGDLAYCVFSSHKHIFFGAFDSLADYYLYEVDDHDSSLAPSIAVTPEDRLHIVWQRDLEDGKIFYKEARKVIPEDIRNGNYPDWSGEFQISRPGHTEPASNPSVEAYGEYVYAAWRGPNENGELHGDIWRRARWLPYEDPTIWEEPRNMSETRDNESNYPVMSTNFVTVWQESVVGNNWDIWGRFETEPSSQPFFETDNTSKYPHITSYTNPKIGEFNCYTIWSEEVNDSLYDIQFDTKSYIPRKSESEYDFSYYKAGIGESLPSPYCSERTGYLQYGQYAVDYGNQRLKYKLPYLNPNYYYDIRSITYQRGNNNWQEQFYIDSVLHSTVTYIPNRPETVWIRILKSAYENDAKVQQKIGKLIGNWAVVADLRLYQIESIDSTCGGSGQQSACITSLQRPSLYQPFPNPFKSQTIIRYSLPNESKVSLSIYDISGRLIKTLVDQHQTSGIYSVNWDGKDDEGRTLSQGIYFYRLKTDGFADTKIIILIK